MENDNKPHVARLYNGPNNPWMDEAYELEVTEEKKLVTIRKWKKK
jgi:hypothetical protein